MRIIGGTLKGLKLNPPKNLPVRPTTDMAKEALFNILQNQVDFDGLRVLDLFSGTGNISLEFASIEAFKEGVFKYLDLETDQFDLIFADPPYDLNKIPEIPKIIFDKKLLASGGLLIVEHQSLQNLSNHPAFMEQRKYGHASFSFFKAP
jgi:16S rRNA (guanine966-N2)-methyltransferase